MFQRRQDPFFELIVIIIIFFVVRKIIPSRGRNNFCRGWKAVVKRGWCTPSTASIAQPTHIAGSSSLSFKGLWAGQQLSGRLRRSHGDQGWGQRLGVQLADRNLRQHRRM